MREIAEILDDAKDGKIPTHEECFWTMLAVNGKLHESRRNLETLGEKMDIKKDTGKETPVWVALELRVRSFIYIFNDFFNFYKSDPQVYLGDLGNPFNKETKKFRNKELKIIESFTKKSNERS